MKLTDFNLVPYTTETVKSGDRFGRLTVLATGRPWDSYRYQAVCQCDCGSPAKTIRIDSLRKGSTTSCGCFFVEQHRTHGLTKHPLYDTWRHMLDRCNKSTDAAYPDYGGRGISVCQRWLDVTDFVHDLEPLYQAGLEMDRIDNDGNYEPSNVRFVPRKVNAGNRRTAHLLTYKGETKSLQQWAEQFDMRYQLLWDRIVIRKWSAEKALNTPPLNVKERMALARSKRCK